MLVHRGVPVAGRNEYVEGKTDQGVRLVLEKQIRLSQFV